MSAAAKVAVGVASGYLLGRTKKLKLAITVGSMLAGKKIATNPRALMEQSLALIERNPELAKLSDQVRNQLYESARAAALATAGERMNRFSDSIRDRSDRLALLSGEGEEHDEKPEDEYDEYDEEGEEPGESEEQAPDQDRERPPRRSAAHAGSGTKRAAAARSTSTKKASATKSTSRRSGTAGKRSAPARRSSAKKTAPTQKSAKSTAKRSGTAKKTAAKKTAPTTKRTAKKSTAKKSTAKKSSSSSRTGSSSRGRATRKA